MNEITVQLEKIRSEFKMKRKKLKRLQETEGVTKTMFGSCYSFNLGNELTDEQFHLMFK